MWVDLLTQPYVMRNVVVEGMTPGDVHESADRCGGLEATDLCGYWCITS